jgi:hypothetical protein
MTHDEFVEQMVSLSQAAQLRLSKASRDKRYLQIPQRELVKLYEKYRNIDFAIPDNPFELAVLTFGFVELAAIHKMKELYFAALKAPPSWPAVVQQCRAELDRLASQVIAEMESSITGDQRGV